LDDRSANVPVGGPPGPTDRALSADGRSRPRRRPRLDDGCSSIGLWARFSSTNGPERPSGRRQSVPATLGTTYSVSLAGVNRFPRCRVQPLQADPPVLGLLEPLGQLPCRSPELVGVRAPATRRDS